MHPGEVAVHKGPLYMCDKCQLPFRCILREMGKEKYVSWLAFS